MLGSASTKLPVIRSNGKDMERERLRLIAIYNLPYRDFLFVLFFHPAYTYIVVFVKLQGHAMLHFADVWLCHTTTLQFPNEKVSMLR